ncbi:hypothetical protein EG329_002300 [Mollisiaceae sp. DMI_Dod_QoI]|nr:hypothetical protein EG329_002300 [Helotiales sp. DMI_Dod_QoI]
MSSPKIYSSLPSITSIRLLRLDSGDVDDPLSCSLIVVEDYASAPEYHALSYCWGDAKDKVELLCNGMPFSATKNLRSALLCLRKKTVSELVWADAICINQKDGQERNQQLSVMKQIYLLASRVFIWIGHGDETTGPAMKLIRTIGHGCCKEIHGSDVSPILCLASLRSDPDRTQRVTSTNLTELVERTRIDWQLIWKFYQSAWFFRVWVIQEVRGCMEISLLCGEEEIEWELVVLAANWVSHAFDRDPKIHWTMNYLPSFTGFQNAFFMWDQSCVRREAPFLALLNLVRRFHSTDPRDKVFALLQHPILQTRTHDQNHRTAIEYSPKLAHAVSNEISQFMLFARVTHLDFKADYEMTVGEVYRRVALDSIHSYRSLEVLCYAWQTQHLDVSLPSWIPRWDIPFDIRTVLLPFIYDAAEGTVPQLRPSPNLHTLTVQGLNLGQILEVDCVLRFDKSLARTAGSNKEQSTEGLLMIMSRILVQDRWQEDISLEIAARRSHENLEAHFADFSAFLLSQVMISK